MEGDGFFDRRRQQKQLIGTLCDWRQSGGESGIDVKVGTTTIARAAAFTACGVGEVEEHGRLDAETLAGHSQLFDAQRSEVVDTLEPSIGRWLRRAL